MELMWNDVIIMFLFFSWFIRTIISQLPFCKSYPKS